MKNALSLFRIFDIGFFIPGALVFIALWYSWGISEVGQQPTPQALSSSTGIIQALLALGIIYILGLLIHAIQRVLLRKCFSKLRPQPKTGPWYHHLANEQREQLVLYFWYLRATCWNLAVAIPAALILIGAGYLQKIWPYTFVFLGVAFALLSPYLLFFLGHDFWGAFHSGAIVPTEETQGSSEKTKSQE